MNHAKFIKLLNERDNKREEVRRSVSHNGSLFRPKFQIPIRNQKSVARLPYNEFDDFKHRKKETMPNIRLRRQEQSSIGSKELRRIINQINAVSHLKNQKLWNSAINNNVTADDITVSKEQKMLKDVKKRFFYNSRLNTHDLLYVDDLKEHINKLTDFSDYASKENVGVLTVGKPTKVELCALKPVVYKIELLRIDVSTLFISKIIRVTRRVQRG